MKIQSSLFLATLLVSGSQAFAPNSIGNVIGNRHLSRSQRSAKQHADEEDPNLESLRNKLEREWSHQKGGPEDNNIDNSGNDKLSFKPPNKYNQQDNYDGPLGPPKHRQQPQQGQPLNPFDLSMSHQPPNRQQPLGPGSNHGRHCHVCHGSRCAYLGGTRAISCPECTANKHTQTPVEGWTKGAKEVPVLDDPNSRTKDSWIQHRQQELGHMAAPQRYNKAAPPPPSSRPYGAPPPQPYHHAPPPATSTRLYGANPQDNYAFDDHTIDQSPYAPSIEGGLYGEDGAWIPQEGFLEDQQGFIDAEFYFDQEDDPMFGNNGGYFGPPPM